MVMTDESKLLTSHEIRHEHNRRNAARVRVGQHTRVGGAEAQRVSDVDDSSERLDAGLRASNIRRQAVEPLDGAGGLHVVAQVATEAVGAELGGLVLLYWRRRGRGHRSWRWSRADGGRRRHDTVAELPIES